MARIYYAVVDGDPLTSGGYVTAPPNGGTIQDEQGRKRNIAYIGHNAWCAKCKTMGRIIGGAGISDHMRTLNRVLGGLKQAVSGDRVACGCEEHPRIIAQYARCWRFVDKGSGDPGYESQRLAPGNQTTSATHATNDLHDHDEQVRAIGAGASDGYPWFIEMADGRTLAGRLDARALLSRISTEVAGDYVIYWGDEALAKQVGE
jgi:hypothetical protein